MVLNNPQFILRCFGFNYIKKVCINPTTRSILSNLYLQHIITKHLFTSLFNMSRETTKFKNGVMLSFC
jgi:hypothetical protein